MGAVCTKCLHAYLYLCQSYFHVFIPPSPSLQSLPGALTALCEVITNDPHGGPARIPVELFHKLYSYLADIDGDVSADQIVSVMQFLNTEAYVH